MSLNIVTLIGNGGQDPDIRSTQDGRELANFSIATTESWKDKSTGEKRDKTEWHRIVVFSQGLVGVIKNYVKKGSKLYIEGQLQTRKWTDKDGAEKYTTEIVLQNYNSNLQMLDSRGSQGSGGDQQYQASPASQGQSQSQSSPANDQPAENFSEELDDDIPF
jgi:single-strand DNA-binding protein